VYQFTMVRKAFPAMTGEELQAWRKAQGWSTAQAAEEFGYSQRGWQHAEKIGASRQLVAAIRRGEKK